MTAEPGPGEGLSVSILDYGMGNLLSVARAFESLGAATRLVTRADEVAASGILIVPGVGAFGDAMERLAAGGLVESVRSHAARGRPLLGICLGMQLLFETSHEKGVTAGLGIFPGEVIRFGSRPGFKIPHMGWNRVVHPGASRLLDGVNSGSFVYFVHSYHPVAGCDGDVIARTDYGDEFPSIVGREPVFGVQFHPEKSQKVGLKILTNFLTIARSIRCS